MTNSKDTYCPSPWHGGFFAYGEYSVCCAHPPVTMGSIPEFLSSDHVYQIKKNLVSGTPDEGCTRCMSVESTGGKSIRQIYLRGYPLSGVTMNQDPEQISRPELIEIRLSNLCNYRCRICKPKWSSSLDQEVQEHPELRRYFIEHNLGKQWGNKQFVQDIVDMVPDLKWVNFTGGEPMIIPELMTILHAMVDSGRSQEIALQITTNLSAIHPKILDLFGKFRHVQLTLSIDGVGTVAEYIRDGTVWPRVERNFLQYIDLRRGHNNIALNPNIALSAYSVLTVDQVFEFLAPYRRSRLISLDMILVEDLAAAVAIEGRARTQAIASLKRSIDIVRDLDPEQTWDIDTIVGQLRGVIDILENQPPDATRVKLLREYTQDLDRTRAQSFGQIFGFDL